MNHSPGHLLRQIRSHYCDRLRQAIDDYVSDGIVQMASEAVLRKADGTLARRGEPPTPARVDLITLIDGQVRDGLTIESDTMPSFSPFALKWQHVVPVEVGPFPWNACDVRIPGGASVMDWWPLAEWFETAFDPEEQKKPRDDGLIGVVHTMARLPDTDGAAAWQIDFGSANIDAFEGMLDALHRVGVASVRIGKLAPVNAPTMSNP